MSSSDDEAPKPSSKKQTDDWGSDESEDWSTDDTDGSSDRNGLKFFAYNFYSVEIQIMK